MTRKVELGKQGDYDSDGYDWIGHPRGDVKGADELLLMNNRSEIEVLWEIEDVGACYSYDDWALVRLFGKYYVLNTSGCSCPSPTETWSVTFSGTLDEVRGFFERYEESFKWGVPVNQKEQFAQAMSEVVP